MGCARSRCSLATTTTPRRRSSGCQRRAWCALRATAWSATSRAPRCSRPARSSSPASYRAILQPRPQSSTRAEWTRCAHAAPCRSGPCRSRRPLPRPATASMSLSVPVRGVSLRRLVRPQIFVAMNRHLASPQVPPPPPPTHARMLHGGVRPTSGRVPRPPRRF